MSFSFISYPTYHFLFYSSIFFCFYQVKIWNLATNKTNYTVTVVAENLECRPPSLLVYGGQDIPDYLTSATTDNRIHFLGNRKLLTLESSVNNGNGQNECVFRHMCVMIPCATMCLSLYRMCQIRVHGNCVRFLLTNFRNFTVV